MQASCKTSNGRPKVAAGWGAKWTLLPAVAIGLAGAPHRGVLADAPKPPEETAAVEPLQLVDPLEPFVPLRPRTGREEDHVRALALFAAGRVAEQKQDYELALRNYQRAFRFDSGALAVDRRGPTISGQRLTIALCTKPKRRKAAPPMAGSSSDTARGRLERGGGSWGARTRLLISVPMP